MLRNKKHRKLFSIVEDKHNEYMSKLGLKLKIGDHFYDRLVDRVEDDPTLTNVVALLNKGIKEKLCEIIYAFYLPEVKRVELKKGLIVIGLTFHQEYNVICARTIITNRKYDALKFEGMTYQIIF